MGSILSTSARGGGAEAASLIEAERSAIESTVISFKMGELSVDVTEEGKEATLFDAF